MSGGWYSVLNTVTNSDDMTFSKVHKFVEYRDKPNTRQMIDSEILDLANKPVVIPVKSMRKNKKVLKKVSQLNSEVLDAVNKKHAMLCGFPTFNRWTPPAKYLRLRSLCDLNFSVKYNERKGIIFPERRFVRYVNTVNTTEELLIKSSTDLLRCRHLRSHTMKNAVKGRIRLIKQWLYHVSLADYINKHQRKKIKSNHFSSLKLKNILISLTRALSMKVR